MINLKLVAIVLPLIPCHGRDGAVIYFRPVVNANISLLQFDLDSAAVGRHFTHSYWNWGILRLFLMGISLNLLYVSNLAQLHWKWWAFAFSVRLLLFLHLSWGGRVLYKFSFVWEQHPASTSLLALVGLRVFFQCYFQEFSVQLWCHTPDKIKPNI